MSQVEGDYYYIYFKLSQREFGLQKPNLNIDNIVGFPEAEPALIVDAASFGWR